jgi:hypothetical protein
MLYISARLFEDSISIPVFVIIHGLYSRLAIFYQVVSSSLEEYIMDLNLWAVVHRDMAW